MALRDLLTDWLPPAVSRALADRPPMATNFSDGSIATAIGAGSGSAQHSQLYASVGWLHAVVSRIATDVAQTDWQAFRERNGEAEMVDPRQMRNSALIQLWRRPNPYMTRAELVEAVDQHMSLAGEIRLLLLRNTAGRVVELWPIRPDRLTPVPSRTDFLKGFIYRIGSEKIPLEPNDVLSVLLPNPDTPYRGIGPVQSIIPDLESEKLSSQWSRNFFRNSAQPGGIIELQDTNLSDAEFERFARRWQSQHGGTANAHRVALLERGKWVDRKFSQREMQFTELKKINRDIILGAFGFPQALLGISDNINRANAEAADVMYSSHVIRPRLVRIQSALNDKLAPMLGEDDGLVWRFVNPVPNDRTLALQEARGGYDSGFLTKDEARSKLGFGATQDDTGATFKVGAPTAPAQRAIKAPAPAQRVEDSGGSSTSSRENDRITLRTPDELPPELTKHEARQRLSWVKRLDDEAVALVAFLVGAATAGELIKPSIELGDIDAFNWNWEQRYGLKVLAELEFTFKSSMVLADVGISPDAAELEAKDWAKIRTAQLLRDDESLSLVETTRKRTREIVQRGLTAGSSVDAIATEIRGDNIFSAARAKAIARTETATAIGKGTQRAAIHDGAREHRWSTVRDDRVSQLICAPNEAQGWLSIGQPFGSGHDTIPGHVNCRCVIEYRMGASSISPEEDIQQDIAAAIEESRAVESQSPAAPSHSGALPTGTGGVLALSQHAASSSLKEARCPTCRKLLAKDVPAGLKHWCRRCKAERVV